MHSIHIFRSPHMIRRFFFAIDLSRQRIIYRNGVLIGHFDFSSLKNTYECMLPCDQYYFYTFTILYDQLDSTSRHQKRRLMKN